MAHPPGVGYRRHSCKDCGTVDRVVIASGCPPNRSQATATLTAAQSGITTTDPESRPEGWIDDPVTIIAEELVGLAAQLGVVGGREVSARRPQFCQW